MSAAGGGGRLRQFLGEPQSALGLGAFRALFGALMLLSTLRFLGRGWVDELYVAPRFHFTYLGFEWLRPWPAAGVYLHFALLALSALSLMLGYRARLSAAAFCLLFTWVELWEKASYLNHYYLVSLLAALLAVVPCGNALSVDARRRATQRAAAPPAPEAKQGLKPVQRAAPLAPALKPAPKQAPRAVRRADYWLLRGQLACVYGYAGLAKLNGDWLLRAEPVRGWLLHYGDLPLIGGLLSRAPTAFALSWLGALFDLCVVPLLCWRRTRRGAFALAVVFHVSNWLMFPIGIFSWLMLICLTLFFDPAWPELLLRRLGVARRAPSTPEKTWVGGDAGLSGKLAGRWLGLAAGFLLVQLLLPLRGLLYPGELNWTEQGFRFSWRVMLVEKSGVVEFDVTSAEGRFRVYPRDELTPLQLRMMSTAPDMIHEYALHLAARFRAEGHHAVQVRARAYASMNGRASSPLIDPAVDLAAQPRSLGHAAFVTLAPE